MEDLIDIEASPVSSFLDRLLRDMTTKRNIIWATDTYADCGPGFLDTDEMNIVLRGSGDVSFWLCNEMNNHLDREWFGREGVFNTGNADYTWSVSEDPVAFPPQSGRKVPLWQRYIDSRRLEITCGEAPYLVSRYDSATGARILPIKKRIGLLDRKLRIVSENAANRGEWAKWALRAYEACYGYEYQGDSLLIARVNLLLTFCDYHQERWGQAPEIELLAAVIERIVWNVWQMDGLKDTVPLGKPCAQVEEFSLFEASEAGAERPAPVALPCRIKDWRRQKSLCYHTLKSCAGVTT